MHVPDRPPRPAPVDAAPAAGPAPSAGHAAANAPPAGAPDDPFAADQADPHRSPTGTLQDRPLDEQARPDAGLPDEPPLPDPDTALPGRHVVTPDARGDDTEGRGSEGIGSEHTADAGSPEPDVPEEPPLVAPRARHRPPRSSFLPEPRLGVLWPVAALAAVGLVGASTLRGRPLPDDGRLTAPAFDLLRGGSDLALLAPESVGAVHAAVYTTVTRAFQRHETLAGAGRELMLAVLLASAVLVWRTTRRLGAGDLAAAVAVLAFGAVPWLAPAHAIGGPAALAAGWLLVVGWLLAPGRPSPAAWAAAFLSAVLAVLMAPDTLVLVLAALAAAVGTGRLRPGWSAGRRATVTALLAAASAGARLALPGWDPQVADPGRWAASTPGLVAVGLVVLGVGVLTALWRPRLQPVGIAVALTTVLAVLPPSGRLPALLLCLPVAAVLVGVLVDGLLSPALAPASAGRRRRRRARPSWVPGAVVAAALALALIGGLTAVRTVPRSDFGATAIGRLAGWAAEQLPEGSRLSVPATLGAELVHAGMDPDQLGNAADPRLAATAEEGTVLRVVTGEPPADSAPVARLDGADGLPALTVVNRDPVAPTIEEVERRRVLGEALAANPTTLAGEDVRAVLASGELDPRLMSLLAGIGAASGIGLEGIPVVPGEEGRTLPRYAVLTSVGGVPIAGDAVQTERVLTLLRAQRPPYTPDVVREVGDGLLVGYRYVPDPDAVLTRAGVG